jgi:hypothetical protein
VANILTGVDYSLPHRYYSIAFRPPELERCMSQQLADLLPGRRTAVTTVTRISEQVPWLHATRSVSSYLYLAEGFRG